MDRFPVLFQPLACLAQHDTTEEVCEMLTKLTTQLQYVFRELEIAEDDLNMSPNLLIKELTDFFFALQPRGILTCLGVRRTNSSTDDELLPEKIHLINQFNRLYTTLTED